MMKKVCTKVPGVHTYPPATYIHMSLVRWVSYTDANCVSQFVDVKNADPYSFARSATYHVHTSVYSNILF